MELNNALKQLKELQKKTAAYNHALGILFYDAETVAPNGSAQNRGNTIFYLSQEIYALSAGEETGRLLTFLYEKKEELGFSERRQVEELYENYQRTAKIPADEYIEYNVLINEAGVVWKKAKDTNDFALFCPYLDKIIRTNRKFAAYYDSEKHPYNVWLDVYEKGLDMEKCDSFFGAIKEKLVPLIAKIARSAQPKDDFLYTAYPLEKQRAFSDYLTQILLIDRNHCILGEVEHPFTANYGKTDVRLTSHYYENNFISNMFSIIHEGGHALYELHTGDDLQYTCLGTGVSMGIHESQSRLYENNIGRSHEFLNLIFPKLLETFPQQLQGVTIDALYKAVNKAAPSLIRIEADELTYPLHIIIRYELEKQMMEGTLDAKDLPAAWSGKVKEYLGLDVPTDSKGVLQDSHWSGGSMGYFPSYAFGSAYAAQFIHKMRETVDIEKCVSKGDLSPINNWLETHIWKKGCLFTPAQLIRDCTGEDFNHNYYIDYLTDKYSSIYGIK